MIEYHILEKLRAIEKDRENSDEKKAALKATLELMLNNLKFAKETYGLTDSTLLMEESVSRLFNRPGLKSVYYHLTPKVKEAVFQARNEALHLADDHIGTEHLFLALTKVSADLPRMGITHELVESTIKNSPDVRDKVTTEGFSLSPSVIVAFGVAASEMNRLGYEVIHTDHLILGLISGPEEKSVIARLLAKIGVNRDHLRQRISNNIPQQKRQ